MVSVTGFDEMKQVECFFLFFPFLVFHLGGSLALLRSLFVFIDDSMASRFSKAYLSAPLSESLRKKFPWHNVEVTLSPLITNGCRLVLLNVSRNDFL